MSRFGPIIQRVCALFALALMVLASGNAAEAATSDPVTVTLVAASTASPAHQTELALVQSISPGWHTYWRNPGDVGQATEVTVRTPAGWRAGLIQWPAPETLSADGMTSYVYQGSVITPFWLLAPGDAKQGTKTRVQAHVSLVACKDSCIPIEKDVVLQLPVAEASTDDPVWFPRIVQQLGQLPSKPDFEDFIQTGSRATLILQAQGIQSARHAEFFPSEASGAFAPAGMEVKGDKGQFSFILPPGQKPIEAMTGVLKLDNGKSFDVAAYRQANGSGAPLDLKALVGGAGFAFLGGLLLNLMPCVFPVLSMKAAALVAHQSSARTARFEGLAYLLGVLTAFWSLAGLLVAARHGGSALGWGFQMQSPHVVAILALVMLASALNLSGVFEFGAFAQGVGINLQTKAGPVGAFFTGALAVVAASPCTGPFMASSIGWALGQPDLATFVVFTALGLGLASPFTALAFSPQLRRLLPRPGAWMDTFRKVLAFPLYGAAAWLAWVFGSQVGQAWMPSLYLSALLVSFGLWTIGHAQHLEDGSLGRAIADGLALLAAGVSIYLVFSSPENPAKAPQGAGAVQTQVGRYSQQALSAALASGHMVFVDFTADWCLTCKVNEGGALSDHRVVSAFQMAGVITLRADWTRRDPEITRALTEQHRVGTPLYLLYSVHSDQPKILPQILTTDIVINALRNSGAGV